MAKDYPELTGVAKIVTTNPDSARVIRYSLSWNTNRKRFELFLFVCTMKAGGVMEWMPFSDLNKRIDVTPHNHVPRFNRKTFEALANDIDRKGDLYTFLMDNASDLAIREHVRLNTPKEA